MRVERAAFLVALAVASCGRTTSPAPGRDKPAPAGVDYAEPFSQIELGDVTRHRVSASDRPCHGYPVWQCRYFRLTAPREGPLQVTLTAHAGTLDVSVVDTSGGEWWDPRPTPGLVVVTVPARAGETYQIAVWEYEFPGVEFELHTALK